MFQYSSSNIHKLVKEMNRLLLGILNKFVLPRPIHSANKIREVNICQENQNDDNDLLLGSGFRSYFIDVDDDLAGTSELAQFYVHIREYLFSLWKAQ